MQLTEKQRMNLLLHADDMEVSGQQDDAKALRYLLAAHSAGAQEPVGELVIGECKNGYSAPWLFRLFDGVQAKDGMQLYAHPPPVTDAVRDVLAERRRQVEQEGWTPEHDDEHDPGVLASAAAAYAGWAADMLYPLSTGDGDRDREGAPPVAWPWDKSWWKPTTPRRALEKAGALILAEIERIERAKVER